MNDDRLLKVVAAAWELRAELSRRVSELSRDIERYQRVIRELDETFTGELVVVGLHKDDQHDDPDNDD